MLLLLTLLLLYNIIYNIFQGFRTIENHVLNLFIYTDRYIASHRNIQNINISNYSFDFHTCTTTHILKKVDIQKVSKFCIAPLIPVYHSLKIDLFGATQPD